MGVKSVPCGARIGCHDRRQAFVTRQVFRCLGDGRLYDISTVSYGDGILYSMGDWRDCMRKEVSK